MGNEFYDFVRVQQPYPFLALNSNIPLWPLLNRFKDFIPAKYHSLYDQYLRTSERKSNVPGKEEQ